MGAAEDRSQDPTTDQAESLSLSVADRAALGAFRSVHRLGSMMYDSQIRVLTCGTLFFGLFAAGMAYTVVSEARLGRRVELGVAMTVVFGVIAGTFAVFRLRQGGRGHWRVYLFEHGFVRAVDGEQSVLWKDVASLFVEAMASYRNLRMVLQDGREVSVDNLFGDFDALSSEVVSGVTEEVLGRAVPVLSRGGVVEFGPFKVTPTGLACRERTVAWPDLHSVSFGLKAFGNLTYTALLVWKTDAREAGGKIEWAAERLTQLPNADALLRLMSQHVRIEALG